MSTHERGGEEAAGLFHQPNETWERGILSFLDLKANIPMCMEKNVCQLLGGQTSAQRREIRVEWSLHSCPSAQVQPWNTAPPPTASSRSVRFYEWGFSGQEPNLPSPPPLGRRRWAKPQSRPLEQRRGRLQSQKSVETCGVQPQSVGFPRESTFCFCQQASRVWAVSVPLEIKCCWKHLSYASEPFLVLQLQLQSLQKVLPYFCPAFPYINKSPLKAVRRELGAGSASWDPLPGFLRVLFSPVNIYTRENMPVTSVSVIVDRYQGAKPWEICSFTIRWIQDWVLKPPTHPFFNLNGN